MSEALLAAAVSRQGKTTLINMAQDPDIGDLIDLYSEFSPVRIRGKGTSKLIIESDGIDVAAEYSSNYSVPGDYLEAATIAAAVLAVGGDVIINGFDTERILPIVPTIRRFGAQVILTENEMHVVADGKPLPCDFTTCVWPGFPTDAQGPFLTVAALAKGQCTVKETIWTNRLTQAPELNRLGAHVTLIDSQTAITQPTDELCGTSVTGTCPRATAGLLIAGMCAKGRTIVSGVDLLRNAYGELEQNLCAIGAKLSVKSSDEDKDSRSSSAFGRLEAF